MTFLRAIPCLAVSPRRSFSAKMGALSEEDVPCAARIFLARRSFGIGGSSMMKITEDVRKYTAEQGIAEEEALEKGLAAKSAEFTNKGAQVYTTVI